MGASTIGVNQATNRSEVIGLVLRNCRANLGNTADDLMTGDNWVGSGHDAAPLVTHRMDVGVADTAEKDLNLYVVFG
jgi:hypothetical protein